jgi:hypothetical protein
MKKKIFIGCGLGDEGEAVTRISRAVPLGGHRAGLVMVGAALGCWAVRARRKSGVEFGLSLRGGRLSWGGPTMAIVGLFATGVPRVQAPRGFDNGTVVGGDLREDLTGFGEEDFQADGAWGDVGFVEGAAAGEVVELGLGVGALDEGVAENQGG